MARARRADVELRTEIRKNRRDLKRAEKDFKSFAKNAKGSLVGGFKGAFGQIAAFGSVAGLAEIGREVMDFERGFTRLGIQAELAGTKFDKGKFRTVITGLSLDTGIARGDVLKLADEITNLEGSTGLTADKLTTLTLAAQGTGAEMADLAGLTLGVRDAFKIKEADALNKVLSRFITIGGQGSVPLDKLARGLRSSAGAFARLQGEGEESAATLAAVFQVAAAGGITTVDETSTAVQRLVSNLEILGKTQAQELGIRDAAGDLRPLDQILESIGSSGIIADPQKFKKAFASEPARRLLRILVKSRSEMNGFVESSKGSTALNDSAEKFASSTSGRMSKALNRMKLAIVKAFTPARLDAMVVAADTLADALGFVIDNWKLFLGVLVAVKAVGIGKSLFKGVSAARDLAKAVSKADGALAKLPSGTGHVLKMAGALTAAATAGFALGTALNAALNIDEKLIGKNNGFSFENTAKSLGLSESDLAGIGFETSGAKAKKRAAESAGLKGKSPEEVKRIRETSLSLSRTESQKEERRQERRRSFAGLSISERVSRLPAEERADLAKRAAESGTKETLAALARAAELIAGRPIEIKIDSDVVARANEKAADKRRRPSP